MTLALSSLDRAWLLIVDQWLSYRMGFVAVPGLQVAIRRGAHLLFSKSYGLANSATGEALSNRHLFRIGSHSKTFTSYLLHRAVLAQQLAFDDPLVKFLPELTSATDQRLTKVTVRQLLTHRSGLPIDGTNADFLTGHLPFPDRADLLLQALHCRLVFNPGTETKYSNFGISLLGLALERATGCDYAQLFKTQVMGALRLADTTLTPILGQPVSAGHTRSDLGQASAPLQLGPTNARTPASGVFSTAEDTTMFYHRLLQAGDLLPSTMVQDLRTVHWPVRNAPASAYGLGLGFNFKDGLTLIDHGGGFPGYITYTSLIEGRDEVCSIFGNSGTVAAGGVLELRHRLAETFGPDPVALTVSPPLFDLRRGSIFVVGQNKAAQFRLAVEDAGTGLDPLTRYDDGYRNDALSGYLNVGEDTVFSFDNAGQIIGARMGSLSLFTRDALVARTAVLTASRPVAAEPTAALIQATPSPQ